MTPQESQLVEDLFDRLAKLETLPRDAAAERLIADGTQRAPHALYALVQTALVQDEALKRANARIEELQTPAGGAEPQQDQRQMSFLDSVREAFSGRSQQSSQQRGSVPSVRAGAASQTSYQSQAAAPNYGAQPAYAPQMPPAGYDAPPFGGGGSFLGTAASTAAGMIGGALLLDGIRSMFGRRAGGYGQSAFGALPDNRSSPWGSDANTSGSAADSDLARQAGIDHIGDAARNDANAAGAADDNATNDDDGFTNNDDWNNADDDNSSDDNSDFGDANMDSGSSYDV
jgi:uncharacterized protein